MPKRKKPRLIKFTKAGFLRQEQVMVAEGTALGVMLRLGHFFGAAIQASLSKRVGDIHKK
jgi:hypothetical protein